MNYFAYGITSKSNVEQVLPKNPKSWFPNVLFAHLQATTQIIKYSISVIQHRSTRHTF